MRFHHALAMSAFVACAVATTSASHAAGGYNVTALPPLSGDTYSIARGLNNLGQVVGFSYSSSGDFHATLWSGGQTIDLGALSGGGFSYALGINDAGTIVGQSKLGATMWSGGTATTVGGGIGSAAGAINNAG